MQMVPAVVVVGYIGLLALVLWIVAIRPAMPLREKISGLFQLAAIYTFVMGLLSTSGVFDALSSMQQDLTSTNPVEFLAGNFHMFVVLFSAMEVALDPNTATLLAVPALLVLSVLLVVYAVFHFVVIVPLAYFCYLVTSVPVDAILNASTDVEITIGLEKMRIKELVVQNEAVIRNFAVGVPAFAASLILKIWPLLSRKGP